MDKIYKNEFYTDILKLFDTVEFQNIKKKYMTDELNSDTTFMYLLMMIYIHKTFYTKSSQQINEQSISIIHELIINSSSRKDIMKICYQFFNHNRNKIIKIMPRKYEYLLNEEFHNPVEYDN